MRGKSLALLSLALGCGLVASVGITQVMSRRNAEPAGPAGDVQAVFVALENIDPGKPLTSQVLKLEDWPKEKVPEGALSKIEDIEGRRARTRLFAGMPILDNALFTKGTTGGGATSMIPKGYRVVVVKVDSVSGGSSMIQPGDRVDVVIYINANSRVGVTEAGIRTVLQDVKVFAVNAVFGLDPQESGGKSIAAKTISLLVRPDQAHKVMLATELGKVRLVMRSPEDEEIVDALSVSSSDLFGGPGTAEEPADNQGKGSDFLSFLQGGATGTRQPSLPAVGTANQPQHTMRILTGADVSDVVFEATNEESHSTSPFGKWKVTKSSSALSLGPAGRAAGPSLPPPPTDQPPSEEPKEKEETGEKEAQEEEAEEGDN